MTPSPHLTVVSFSLLAKAPGPSCKEMLSGRLSSLKPQLAKATHSITQFTYGQVTLLSEEHEWKANEVILLRFFGNTTSSRYLTL